MKSLTIALVSAGLVALGSISTLTIQHFLGKDQPTSQMPPTAIERILAADAQAKQPQPAAVKETAEELYKKGLELESQYRLPAAQGCYSTLIEQYPGTEYAKKAAERRADLGAKIGEENIRRTQNIMDSISDK